MIVESQKEREREGGGDKAALHVWLDRDASVKVFRKREQKCWDIVESTLLGPFFPGHNFRLGRHCSRRVQEQNTQHNFKPKKDTSFWSFFMFL